MSIGATRLGPVRRTALRTLAAVAAGHSRTVRAWLLAAGALLLATLLLATDSVAWNPVQRQDRRAPLDPARYDVVLDVPRAPGVARTRFGVGPRRDVPPAVLRIRRLQIEVAVQRGTSDDVLLHGAGLIAGSAPPGSAGHIGVAMHRDRQFRRLGELAPGDVIALDTADSTAHYRVTRLKMAVTRDATLLAADSGAVLTLVASYPFESSRQATPRFIVRAERVPAPR